MTQLSLLDPPPRRRATRPDPDTLHPRTARHTLALDVACRPGLTAGERALATGLLPETLRRVAGELVADGWIVGEVHDRAVWLFPTAKALRLARDEAMSRRPEVLDLAAWVERRHEHG